jgi:hypothetical protein
MIDISKEGYELSSELFSFKDMRRGVIEHGKVCYIEGYKKHAELFCNFLIKNGYFDDFELNNVLAEFDSFLNDTPAISCNYAESLLSKVRPWLGKDAYLYYHQKDVIELYKDLTNEKNILRIQKPRQGGVTTALYLIAYMECLNKKRVLYYGYDEAPFASQYFKYIELNHISGINEKSLVDKRYDLVIIDEIFEFENPDKDLKNLKKCLTENGRIIISCTPSSKERNETQYKTIRDFFEKDYPDVVSYKWKCTDKNIAQSEKYPEFKNEILGEFIE